MTTVPAMTETIRDAIRALVAGRSLAEDEAREVATSLMTGDATPAQIAALLIALRVKGETIDEIVGFARAMRQHVESVQINGDAIDTCGTGGDGKGTFNVSTVAALVAAGAGCRVAKHGNRSVSSRCGSAEVLEALGVDPRSDADTAASRLDRHGIVFLYAPDHHPATRHAVTPRREIGVRSIFNIIGPLTNPAGVRRQLIGVYDPRLTETLARVLDRLGARHCMVVHGEDGLDEITLAGRTRVSELRDGAVRSYSLDPRDLGFPRRATELYVGGDPEQNARIALRVLEGCPGPEREIVEINAGAVIYIAGIASSLAEGVEAARSSIDSGRALARLHALRSEGNGRNA